MLHHRSKSSVQKIIHTPYTWGATRWVPQWLNEILSATTFKLLARKLVGHSRGSRRRSVQCPGAPAAAAARSQGRVRRPFAQVGAGAAMRDTSILCWEARESRCEPKNDAAGQLGPAFRIPESGGPAGSRRKCRNKIKDRVDS